MKNTLRHTAAAALAAALVATQLVGCANVSQTSAQQTAATTSNQTKAPVTLRLIGINDLHGNLEATGLSLPWPDPANREKPIRLDAGGAAYLAGTVQALRAGTKNSLVLSSGDMIGGTPLISALFLHESTIDVANMIGVDIAIPGNHEFDAGQEELLRVLKPGCRTMPADAVFVSCPSGPHPGAKFPLFVANVLKADGSTLFPASVVRTVDGVRVGFIGAVTKITPSIVVPSGVAGLSFIDEAQAINAEAARLTALGVRALVAVIHEGGQTGTPGLPLEWNDVGCPNPRGAIFEITRQLSQAIDIVYSAHTHQGYRCLIGEGADARPVMQATALGRGVSVADLVIDANTGEIDRARTTHRNLPVFNSSSNPALRAAIINSEAEPWASVLRNAQPVAAVAQRVAAYAAAAAPRANRPVGRIGGNFDRNAKTDASAGRLIADAQWQATRQPERGAAQFALMNPGGVRSDLRCAGTPPCAISYGQAFTMQPFGNNLVVMTLTGAEVKQVLEDQQREGRESPSFLIPSSTLTYRWVAAAPYGQRVQDLRVSGQPVDAARDYRLTVNNFMADGGDAHVGFRAGRNRLGGALDIEALADFLAASNPMGPGVTPDPTPRITLVE